MKFVFLIAVLLGFNQAALAKIDVLVTTPDLGSLVRTVGGDLVTVAAIAKGTQDPHYIEAKPSYMVRASKANLVISVGLDLESAWLPSILRGARNPSVLPGSKGYLEVGPLLNPAEIPQGKVTRAEGDVHPLGNPHVLLDPVRAGDAAVIIANRLTEFDSANGATYKKNAKAFQDLMNANVKKWQERIARSGTKNVITYHKTLNYFCERFGLKIPISLEPKPGIPPSAGHVLKVIEIAKADKVKVILVENYFDPTVADRVAKEVTGLIVRVVPVDVDGAKDVTNLESLYEKLVSAVEGK